MRNANLTGSNTVRPMTHTTSVSTALRQLRFGVTLCCWAVVLSLLVQAGIWCAASFTGMRWESAAASGGGSEIPLVVTGADEAEDEVRSAFDPVPAPAEARAGGPERVKAPMDSIFATAAGISTGIAAIGAMALLPLMGLGVLLAAASATEGVEKTVSAFGWAMVVIVIVLSFGGVLSMPWADQGNWTYSALVERVDANAGTAGSVALDSPVGMQLAARYMALPLACVVGLLVALGRFRAGVRAGLAPREDLRLDATLESETANIKPSSLHGGRAGAAMQHALQNGNGNGNGHAVAPVAAPASTSAPAAAVPAAVGATDSGPSGRMAPAGEAPKRLI